MINRNRRPLAKVVCGVSGDPQVMWNAVELDAAALSKTELLADLTKLMPPSATEAAWSL